MTDDDLARLRLDKAQLGRHGSRKTRFMLMALLCAALFGGGWLYQTGALTPATSVRLVNATTLYPAQTLALLNASGYVVAQRKAALGSKITSRLVYLGVEEGQQVKAGQVIARLENEDVLAARNRGASQYRSPAFIVLLKRWPEKPRGIPRWRSPRPLLRAFS